RGAWRGNARRIPDRVPAPRTPGRAAPPAWRPPGGRSGTRRAAASEAEEALALGGRAGRLLARRDGAQLGGEPFQLHPLSLLELLELPPAPLMDLLEGAPPARMELRQGLFHAAHHAEGRHERPLAVRAGEDDAGAEVAEGHGVLAVAAEADDRNLPLVGIGERETDGIVRARRRGGRRSRRRGGGGCRRLRLRRRLRGCLPGGALLLEARGRVVGDRLVGMER